jgi:hypothetical protein
VISLSIIFFGYSDQVSELQAVDCTVGGKILFDFPLKIAERNIGV